LRIHVEYFHIWRRRTTTRDGEERLVQTVRNRTNGVCFVAADYSLRGGRGGGGHFIYLYVCE